MWRIRRFHKSSWKYQKHLRFSAPFIIRVTILPVVIEFWIWHFVYALASNSPPLINKREGIRKRVHLPERAAWQLFTESPLWDSAWSAVWTNVFSLLGCRALLSRTECFDQQRERQFLQLHLLHLNIDINTLFLNINWVYKGPITSLFHFISVTILWMKRSCPHLVEEKTRRS